MSNDVMGQEAKFCEMQLIERIEDFIARFKGCVHEPKNEDNCELAELFLGKKTLKFNSIFSGGFIGVIIKKLP